RPTAASASAHNEPPCLPSVFGGCYDGAPMLTMQERTQADSRCAKIRADDDHSRRNSSIPDALWCTGIPGRTQTLSIGRLYRAGLRTAVELWLWTERDACYPHRSLSNQRY